ncbi:tetratricopeptide repeat protein [Pedobacter aquae]|uniref:histidine kinase n=1 Tax=Pedobacter aquae TaxID=2605747 RepID=A0A5C0VM83_9SPHI|nr:tetratricopeptide repeat protein [Pedobacter aquae]QEK52833.1 tetratricopeptide repeat protein [Pedobacter aquae]
MILRGPKIKQLLRSIALLVFLLLPIFGAAFQKAYRLNPQLKVYDSLVSRYRYFKPDSALYFMNQGLELATKLNDANGKAVMLNQWGMIYDNKGNYQESREKYLQALKIYQKTGYVKGISAVNIRLGVVENRKGNHDKAIAYFLKALAISEKNNYAYGIMEANLTVAEGFLGQKNYPIALKYLKKAEFISDTIPFSNLNLNIYNNFGVIYRDIKKYDLAEYYLKKGIALSSNIKYQGLNITLTNNLASVYARTGKKQQAIALQKEALKKAKEIQNFLREIEVLLGLAENYKDTDSKKALAYYKDALNLTRKNNAYKRQVEILNQMVILYRKEGNYKEALTLKEEEKNLADSFLYKDIDSRISDLQAQYELAKSQARVKELQYSNTQQNLRSTIILSVAVFVMIILVFMVFNNRRNRKFNQLLSKANQELKESNSVKDKLFSVLAHDLRGPFAAIINLLSMVKDGYLDEREKNELIDKITQNSTTYLDTLNDLVKWGETQIKGLRINPQPIALAQEVELNKEFLSVLIEDKNISFSNEILPHVAVLADKAHFDLIIRNLLSNAVKFTNTGGSIKVFAEDESQYIRITVKDTGIGMSADKQSRIFNFENISLAGTGNEKGNSLGLILCKEYVLANKGTISVKSKKGEGSEFSFTLPKA